MSQRPKHKHWTIKLLKENSGQSLPDNGFGNDLWYKKQKATKEKLNYTSWNPCTQPLNTLSRDWTDNLTEWERRFGNHISVKEIKYIKNSHLQLNNKTCLNIGQRTWLDVPPNTIYKWPISTWEDAQYHSSLGKCESKSQWDTNSHPLGWLLSKT